MSNPVNLEALKAAMADPVLNWSMEWTPEMFEDGWEDCNHILAAVLNAAPGLIDKLEQLASDNEATDGTDAAHPSYWRGCDATFAAMAEQLRKILDGEDDCTGACQEPWDSLRRRVLGLRQELATAKAAGAAEEVDLLPMSEAPRKGWFTLYTEDTDRLTPVVVIWSKIEQVFVSYYGSWWFKPSDTNIKGWLPLPKIKGGKG